MLIPHTLEVTKLGDKRVGDTVNLEADMIVKHIDRLVAAQLGGERAAASHTPRRETLDRHAAEVRLCPLIAAERHAAVARAIDAIRAGGMVILVDDEDRENEGDLVMAADLVTPEAINFMAREGRGLICLSLTEERVAQLGLTMMAADNRSPRHTAFTVSIDGRRGITTGISARERAETIRAAVARDARPDDIVTPGHVFPLKARRGGVLVRSGHTEGSVDLARLAGREPAGVICEIMREDGEMARMPDLQAFARTHELPVVTIADLIDYRLGQEILVHQVAETRGAAALGRRQQRVPRLRLHDRRRGDRVPRAGARRRPARTSRCWSACRAPTCCATCSGWAPPRSDHPATVSLRMIEEAGRGIMLYVYSRARHQPARPARAAPRVRRRPSRRACATSAWARRCWRTWARARSGC